MGAARKVWDESKHLRGYHGRFAEGRDRSPEVLGSGRAANAFHPRPPAAEARARKERVPSNVRELLGIRDRIGRGEKVGWHDEQKVSWASPRQLAAQRAKTGDILVPRSEIARRERNRRRGVNDRTGIKKTFTGKTKVERGNYRELLIPMPDRPGSSQVRVESRVRRAFDWPVRGGSKAAKPAPPVPKKPPPSFNPALTHDAKLREIAREMGLDIPKRAGRNQLLNLIQGA